MKPRQASDFKQMTDPADFLYAPDRLGYREKDELLRFSERQTSSMRREYEDALRTAETADQKIEVLTRLFRDEPDTYAKYLIESGILELPDSLRWLSVSEIFRKLTPVREPIRTKIRFGVQNGMFENALRWMRKRLSLHPTGGFDEEAGIALFEKLHGSLPIGQGYLASEQNPDLLFDPWHRERVAAVDEDIWRLAGFSPCALVDDRDPVWRGKNNDKFGQRAGTSEKERTEWKQKLWREFVDTVSQDLLQFVSSYEDYCEYPTLDSYGKWNIGYGHNLTDSNEPISKYATGISEEAAWALLLQDMQATIDEINAFAEKHDLQFTQQQFDAMASINYNYGSFWMNESDYPSSTFTMKQDVMRGDFEAAREKWPYYRKAVGGNGPQLGLWRRRMDELEIIFDSEYERNDTRIMPEDLELD